jgi:hypothetical protein
MKTLFYTFGFTRLSKSHCSADSAPVERNESEEAGDLQRLTSSWKGVDTLVSSENMLTSTLSHWVEEGSDEV